MAVLKDLVVTGQSRLLNKIYASSGFDVSGNTSVLNGGLVIRGTYDNLSTCGQLTLFNSSGSGIIMRNDINYTYFLISKSNTDLSFNSLRPMHINMSSGLVSFNHGISTTNVSSGTATFSGLTTHNGGVTVNGTTATTSLTASSGLFTNCQVLDTLRTTKWNIDNVASLGGHFYVSPTILFSSSTTATISAISGTTVTMAIKDSSSITSNSAGGVTWPSGAKVKLSGRLGNVALGTCTGTLTTAMNATAGTITLTFTFSEASSLSVKSYAASEIKDFAIMMYNNGTYPVGIAMTSYGTNGYSYIDIYGGSKAANDPNVRIGKLDGLPAVNGTSPTGWGIYTNNGFFSGTVVSSAGKIGGFSISSNDIGSGTFGTSGSVMMCTGSNTAKSIGNSASTVNGWCFTAGAKFGVTKEGVLYCSDIQATGGKIGRYYITSTYLYTGEGSNQVGIGGNQAFWAGGTSSDTAPFRVSYDGTIIATKGTIGGCSITNNKLTVPAANISGTLTASQIQVGLGGNLYPNYDTFANITNSTLSYAKADTATATVVTNGAKYYGNKSLKIVSTGTDSYVYLGHSSNNYGCIPVIPNKIYRVSCYVAATSASGSPTVELFVVGHTAINATNSAHNSTSLTASTSWQRMSMTYTASSTYPYISLRVDVNKASAEVYFDAFQIEEVSSTSQEASPFKPSGSTMIDGGSIYTNTITSLGKVTAGEFSLGNGNFVVNSSGVMSCKGASITGAIDATSITAKQCYSIYKTESNGTTSSTRFIYYNAPELRIGLPGSATGDLSDLMAGFSFHGSGSTECWGNLSVMGEFTGNTIHSTGTLSCAGEFTAGGKVAVTYSGVGGVTIQGSGTTTGLQITRTDTKYGIRLGVSSSGTVGCWFCDYNKSDTSSIFYRKPDDANATTYIPGRLVMAGSYGTGNPPSSGTRVAGMIYFQIVG